jgi:hypothetical protein
MCHSSACLIKVQATVQAVYIPYMKPLIGMFHQGIRLKFLSFPVCYSYFIHRFHRRGEAAVDDRGLFCSSQEIIFVGAVILFSRITVPVLFKEMGDNSDIRSVIIKCM